MDTNFHELFELRNTQNNMKKIICFFLCIPCVLWLGMSLVLSLHNSKLRKITGEVWR